MGLKEEYLDLTSGIRLAGKAVSDFVENGREILDTYKVGIIHSIVKTNKISAVHYYLSHYQDIMEDIKSFYKQGMGNAFVYFYILKTSEGIGLETTDLTEPDWEKCTGVDDSDYHDETCSCGQEVQPWIDFVETNADDINGQIVHSAFQIVFRDRMFLQYFNSILADFIEENIADIKKVYPGCVTSRNRIKRKGFPTWLQKAVFYRDMGTCSNPECRADLTNLVRMLTNKNFDHIVPLNLFGSNDASNVQLLCKKCNDDKSGDSMLTGNLNTPFWNLT